MITPIALLVFADIVITILSESAAGLKMFLSVIALILPLMMFFAITTWILLKRRTLSLSLYF